MQIMKLKQHKLPQCDTIIYIAHVVMMYQGIWLCNAILNAELPTLLSQEIWESE